MGSPHYTPRSSVDREHSLHVCAISNSRRFLLACFIFSYFFFCFHYRNRVWFGLHSVKIAIQIMINKKSIINLDFFFSYLSSVHIYRVSTLHFCLKCCMHSVLGCWFIVQVLRSGIEHIIKPNYYYSCIILLSIFNAFDH